MTTGRAVRGKRLVAVSIEWRQLLMAVDRLERVVDVERHAFRGPHVTRQPETEQHIAEQRRRAGTEHAEQNVEALVLVIPLGPPPPAAPRPMGSQ